MRLLSFEQTVNMSCRCQIFVQQKPDGLTLVERRDDKEFIMLKASPTTGKVD